MTLHATALPLPRPPVNQGIDITDPIVTEHNETYSSFFSQITPDNNQSNALIFLNPYETAPLSLYIGVWSNVAESVQITVIDQNETAPLIVFKQPVLPGANLIPVAGLLADKTNLVTMISSVATTTWNVVTSPLPHTDAQEPDGHNLFPEITLLKPTSDPTRLADGLYFISCFDRNNIALDYQGNVRWFTTKNMPSNNLLRIANGNFLSSAIAQDNYLKMYEFDMIGRVHTMYVLDNALHHSLYQQPMAHWSALRNMRQVVVRMARGVLKMAYPLSISPLALRRAITIWHTFWIPRVQPVLLTRLQRTAA